jgi:hypothetical protein
MYKIRRINLINGGCGIRIEFDFKINEKNGVKIERPPYFITTCWEHPYDVNGIQSAFMNLLEMILNIPK